jgi:hypothetical protein
MSEFDEKDYKLIVKDLRFLKNDYEHRFRTLNQTVIRIEKRLDWVEKLLWLSAGALISWLITLVLRSM